MIAIPVLLLALRLAPEPQTAVWKQPQVAASTDFVALTFGSANSVYFAGSADGGQSFSKPVKVGDVPALPLGMRRGPRVAVAGNAVLVTAISSTRKGADGDVVLWRSTDRGKTWSATKKLNDVPAAAREGFQTIAASGNRVFVTWLDLRTKGMRLYGTASNDGGATWSENRLVYASPDGHICECCHTNVAVGPDGKLYAMWRNWLNGNRDMYLAVSGDEGRTWKEQKLGHGSWPLNACPMDGGSLSIGPDGKLLTAWRREGALYLAAPGEAERTLGSGKQPVAIATPAGPLAVWSDGAALKILQPGARQPEVLAPNGSFVSLTGTGTGPVIAVWEENGGIGVRQIGIR